MIFNETIQAAVLIIISILLLISAAIIGRGNTVALAAFESQVSEESLAAGLYYSTQAIPCLSANPNQIDETKRFVLDSEVLDGLVVSDHGRLSCAEYGAVKYRISIYDLDYAGGQWTFANFQPLEDEFFMPRYGQVIVLDYYSSKHRGFIAVYVEQEQSSGKLPLEMFCNSTAASEPDDFVSVYNAEPLDDGGYGVEDAYYYQTSGCESENCIKGLGQALPTCQPEFHTYSKEEGESCMLDYECKSSGCLAGKCAAMDLPAKLINGQPCIDDDDCESTVCAHDKRCALDVKKGIDISHVGFS